MKGFVNDRAVGKVYDAWGNEVGLEGALSEGMKIYVTLRHGQVTRKPRRT